MKQRSERIAELVRQTVGTSLVRKLPGQYLTITKVEVSDDMRHTHVWVSRALHVNEPTEKLLDFLNGYKKELQEQIASSLKTRFTPKLHLHIDDGNKYADKIDSLLNKLN